MASNRTYQVLQGVRYLVTQETSATVDTLAGMFRKQKNANKSTFGMAYISPSSLSELLLRLTVDENYLARENGQYHLTTKGSLLADILDHLQVPASSTEFLTQYKAHVANAYLHYKWEAGRPAVAPAAEVADFTGLSEDSVRRGMADLMLLGLVSKSADHYRLVNPPVRQNPPTEPPMSLVEEVLATVNEAPMRPFEPPSPPVGEEPLKAEVGPPAEETEPPALEGVLPIEEAEQIVQEAVTEALVGDAVDQALNKVLPEWLRVDPMIQRRFAARAQTMAFSLEKYLALLDAELVVRARQAFLSDNLVFENGEAFLSGEEDDGTPLRGL